MFDLKEKKVSLYRAQQMSKVQTKYEVLTNGVLTNLIFLR